MQVRITKPVTATCIRSNPPVNMSVLEASEYLNISERKLRDLIACAALRYARIGKRIILRKQDLDSFLEGMVI